ncbi:MAG TPA: hypothetical protein VIT68_02405 [Candidatus Gracilibacteria bacterium]
MLKKNLLHLRYYLEILAVPAFAGLIIHLAGHGSLLLWEGEHDHSAEILEKGTLLETLLTFENLIGIMLLVVFVWVWHRPSFRKWVPCHHDHCHSELPIPHLLAILALCLHFFPEANVRHQLLMGAFAGESLQILALIGFLAHFLIDVIIAIVLSSYWKTRTGVWISFSFIAAVWIFAFTTAKTLSYQIPPSWESFLLVLSAFLLAMFVHKPHRPMPKCKHCA